MRQSPARTSAVSARKPGQLAVFEFMLAIDSRRKQVEPASVKAPVQIRNERQRIQIQDFCSGRSELFG